MKREFLMKAKTFKTFWPGWASEKLDGIRCFWDGGVSHGLPVADIPWANKTNKVGNLDRQIATGLWSTYGKPIFAPEFWLEHLFGLPALDGELWIDYQHFQSLVSIVKRTESFNEDWYRGWGHVKFYVFDMPCYRMIFDPGYINNNIWTGHIEGVDFAYKRAEDIGIFALKNPQPLRVAYTLMSDKIDSGDPYIKIVNQVPVRNLGDLDHLLENVVNAHGEGVMLRDPQSIWTPGRVGDIVKVKPHHDAEGEVVGYTWGDGKYFGLMGSLIVKFGNVIFKLSGFTDAERELINPLREPCKPGIEVGNDVYSENFPRGSQVTFKYRELSRDGVPKEARYFRKRENM